jgi:exopolysaccharide biosynthesis polyprenyl glycosylphosphotransferase
MSYSSAHIQARSAWIAVVDVLCLAVGVVLGVWLRLGPDEVKAYVFNRAEGWLLLFGGVLLANYLAGSYRIQHTFSRFNLLVTWLFSMVFVLLILSITSYAWFVWILGRGILVLSLAAYSVLSLLLKLVLYGSIFSSERFLCRTVILGTGLRAREMRRIVENPRVVPQHRVVSHIRVCPVGGAVGESPELSMDGGESARLLDGVPVIECMAAELKDALKSLDANLLILGLDDPRRLSGYYAQLKRLHMEGVALLTPLSVMERYAGRIPLVHVNEEFLMDMSLESRMPTIRRLKRVMDIIAALAAIVLLVPFGVLIAVAIRIGEPSRPVFYTQERVGQFGRRFRILKFRTMRMGAEEATGPVWSPDDDQRITRVGRFLRRFRLDELPQFLNVLKGEMSLVGPRPERPEIATELEQQLPFFGERENVMPGLSGWAQIRHPYGNTIEDAARKLEFDLYYIKNMSFSLDLQIILSTLQIMVFGKEEG